jgi:hypothetical protein
VATSGRFRWILNVKSCKVWFCVVASHAAWREAFPTDTRHADASKSGVVSQPTIVTVGCRFLSSGPSRIPPIRTSALAHAQSAIRRRMAGWGRRMEAVVYWRRASSVRQGPQGCRKITRLSVGYPVLLHKHFSSRNVTSQHTRERARRNVTAAARARVHTHTHIHTHTHTHTDDNRKMKITMNRMIMRTTTPTKK